MKKLRFACVVGARPNFMKMAPLLRALEDYPVECLLIHTGQHYDHDLSDVFFRDLGMRKPDIHLDIGSLPHGAQTGRMLESLEHIFTSQERAGTPLDRLVVVGDVNSTLAAALAAAKLNIPVAHVEAGLRSFDRTMPEETNRIVTDAISDLLFVSEPAGVENLRREGRPDNQIHLVGNIMIDTLRAVLPATRDNTLLHRLELKPGTYGVVTLHRPSNVDAREVLAGILDVLTDASRRIPLVIPLHPRTKSRLETFGLDALLAQNSRIHVLPPFGYLDFLTLTSQARVIITDSGGLQEESTVLGIPCLTMRENTERPITVQCGTSTLIGSDSNRLAESLHRVLEGQYKQGQPPALWDGRTGERIAAVLAKSRS